MFLPLLKGLAKTFEQCFRKPLTIRYPEEKRDIPERFRGNPRLLKDDQGRTKCVACMLCATVCPSGAIEIEPAEGEEMHIKYPRKYEIDLARCIYCGLCEEACPVNAIELTRNYELSQYNRDELVYDKERLLKEG